MHASIDLKNYFVCLYFCRSFCGPGKYCFGKVFSGLIFLSPKSKTPNFHCCYINNGDISASKTKYWSKNIGHSLSSLSQKNYILSPTWIFLLLLFCTWPVTTILPALVLPCRLPTSGLISFDWFESGSVNYLQISSRVRLPPIFRTSRYFLIVCANLFNLEFMLVIIISWLV